MASAIVGTKRSFTSMNEDAAKRLPVTQDARNNTTASVPTSMPSSRNSSARSTPRHTPVPATTPHQLRREFHPDASIVLIGMRGTGKSTLAVIASIACRRRVIDIDDLFIEATGFSSARYRKQFGAANHNVRQGEFLQTTLRTYDKHAIIVCNGGSLERNGQMLMQEFARTHAVIHIVRDLRSIHRYLGGVEIEKLKDMLAFSAPMLRRCSNLEFFNISESRAVTATHSDDANPVPAFLTLKRAQRTFLKFLALATRQHHANAAISTSLPFLEPGYPLSDVATELRVYTCAVQVSLSALLDKDYDVQALEYGADAFEILVDLADVVGAEQADRIGEAISKVRRGTVIPIIYHIPSLAKLNNSQELYLELIRYGLRAVPDFIVVDLSVGEEVLGEIVIARGSSKIIGSLHRDTPWDSLDWIVQYDMAVRAGCSLVRFSRPSNAIDDDCQLQMLRNTILKKKTSVPLSCYNTGQSGRRSACFNKHLTPVGPPLDVKISSNAIENDENFPLVTARQVTQALYASFTFDPMQIYIIGASLGYTVSPAMHGAGYERCGMPHQFVPVQSQTLNSLKELVRSSTFGGSIIIQPFKIEVMSLTDALSQHARIIGAVNTLIPVRNLKDDGTVPTELELFQERNKSGPVRALYGDNTEWIGIRSCIRRGLTPANAVRPTSCALVIGAGGMARAAIYALVQLGVKNIFISNRTLEKAEKLATYFTGRMAATNEGSQASTEAVRGTAPSFHVVQSREDTWDEKFRQPTIILSCIPADPIDGGPAAQVTLPSQWLQSPTGGVVMEMAYKTLRTPLQQQMVDAGSMWTYLDGLDFIPEQAFAQFELFTGKRAPRGVMREEALRAWKDERGNPDPVMVERRLKVLEDQEP